MLVSGRLLWASHSTLTSPCCSPVGRTVWPGCVPCRPGPVWCATRATCSVLGTAPSPPQVTTSPPVATTGLPGCGPRTRASHSGSSTVISLTWTAWHSIPTLNYVGTGSSDRQELQAVGLRDGELREVDDRLQVSRPLPRFLTWRQVPGLWIQ